jgi:hypothetical protein
LHRNTLLRGRNRGSYAGYGFAVALSLVSRYHNNMAGTETPSTIEGECHASKQEAHAPEVHVS